jgi:hypothetical protein
LSRDYKHHWTPVHLDFLVDNLADAERRHNSGRVPA